MNTINAIVKRLRLSSVLFIFLAGIVLLVNTACSQVPTDKVSEVKNPESSSSGYDKDDNVVLKAVKESYKIAPPEGGMNNHRDTDRRLKSTVSDAKAQDLINGAKDNLKESTRNPKEAVENLKNDAPISKIKNKFQDFSKNVTDSTDEVKKGAGKGFDNLKNNLKSTGDRVSENARQAVQ